MENLFIPQHKLNWVWMDEQLSNQYIELSTLEDELEVELNQMGLVYNDINMRLLAEMADSGVNLSEHPKYQQLLIKEGAVINRELLQVRLDRITDLKRELNSKEAVYSAEKKLFDLLLQIERHKLEPALIYGEPKANQPGVFEETKQQKAFRQQVMVHVKTLEHDDRQIEIKQIENLLTHKIAEFVKTFEEQEPIVQEAIKFKKRQEADSKQPSSSTGNRRQQLGKNKATF